LVKTNPPLVMKSQGDGTADGGGVHETIPLGGPVIAIDATSPLFIKRFAVPDITVALDKACENDPVTVAVNIPVLSGVTGIVPVKLALGFVVVKAYVMLATCAEMRLRPVTLKVTVKPHVVALTKTAPPEPNVCADAGATATDASGRSAAASAAALMCFSGPFSNCCVFACSSV
jgi:hypothetical protein